MLSAAMLISALVLPLHAAPIHDWSQSFAFPSQTQVASVACDPFGNVIIAGNFQGRVDFGGGPHYSSGATDIFVAKFDSAGNHIWSHGFGDFENDLGTAVCTDSNGNVLLAGTFRDNVDFGGGVLSNFGNDDLFVAKFDPNGNHIWSRRFGDEWNQYASGIASDAAGNIALTGYYFGSLNLGGTVLMSGGETDVFVAQFDADGNHRWSQSFGDSGFQRSDTIALDAFGNTTIAGTFQGTVDFGGGLRPSAGGYDIFLASFDNQGSHTWSKSFGDASAQSARAVASDASGNIVLAGYFFGSIDFGAGPLSSIDADAFVAGFDSAGNHRFSQAFGGNGGQHALALVVDDQSGFRLTGYFEQGIDLGGGPFITSAERALFLARFDAVGSHIWSQAVPIFKGSLAAAVALDQDANTILCAPFLGTIDFGDGPIESGRGYNCLVAKFGMDGTHQWGRAIATPGGEAVATSVAIDEIGNVAITGTFTGRVDFGGDPLLASGSSLFLAALDASGSQQWAHQFGPLPYFLEPVVTTNPFGGFSIVGTFRDSLDFGAGSVMTAGAEDIFVAAFDAEGQHVWSQRFGDAQRQFALVAAPTADGGIVISGPFEGTVDFGGGPLTDPTDRAYLVRLDADGIHLWSRGFGGSGHATPSAISTTAFGNTIVAGSFDGSVDFGGGSLQSSNGRDMFLACYDVMGDHRWSQRFGNNSIVWPNAIAVDGAGSIVLTGRFYNSLDFGGGLLVSGGGSDIFVVSFDVDGHHRWSKRFGGASDEQGISIAADALDQYTVTGIARDDIDLGGGMLVGEERDDTFLVQLDSGGNHLWSSRLVASAANRPAAIATNGLGDIALVGAFEGALDFGGSVLRGYPPGSIYVAKFHDSGVPIRFFRFGAIAMRRGVRIFWDVRGDDPRDRFTLLRRDGTRPGELAITEGRLLEADPFFFDTSVIPGESYHYQLVIRTPSDEEQHSPIATVLAASLRARLAQNRPNPFNPTTSIQYTLAEPAQPILSVYDAAGRRVRQLKPGPQQPGDHHFRWDGRDDAGHELASGVYYYRLEGVSGLFSRKMLLLR